MADQAITDMEPRAREQEAGEGSGAVALIYRTLAGLAVGGPLVAVMGFPVLGFLTALLIVISPLLLLFSPVLVPAAMVLFRTIAGLGAAAAIREVINRIKQQLGMAGQEGTGVEPRIRDQPTASIRDKQPGRTDQNITGVEPRESEQTAGGGESRRMALYGTLAGLVTGGPLLVIMGLTLLGSGTVLVIAAPLLLLFSPVLVPAVLGLFAVMGALGVAAAMAVAGLHAIALSYRSATGLARSRSLIITEEEGGGGGGEDVVDVDVDEGGEIKNVDEGGGQIKSSDIKNVEMVTGSGQRVKEQVSKLEDELKTGSSNPTAAA